MNDIIEKIKELALEEREKANKLKADIMLIADDIKNKRLDISFEIVNGTSAKHTACAIDGGKFEFDLGDSYLIMAKAVSVTGNYGDVKTIPPTVIRDFKIISDYYGEDEVRKNSILLMLTLETSLLSKADSDVIFIDGPLIDPPIYDESLDEYFLVRSSIVKNKKPIGIVKRFSHRLLTKYLITQGYELANVRESYLVAMLMAELRKNVKNKDSVFLGWINWGKIFKEGKSLLDLNNLEKAYRKFNLPMYSAYFQLSAISPVVRIDVINQEGIEYVKSWGIEGEKEVTILNKIADTLAKFREEEIKSYVSLFQIVRGFDLQSYLSKF